MITAPILACPTERRVSPRVPLDRDVRVFFASTMEVKATGLDLSLRGVRVRLPLPLPRVVGVEVGVGAELWGPARVGRLSDDRHEAVLVFPRTPAGVARLFEETGERSIADGTPLGRATAAEALRRAGDPVGLIAVLARSAAAFADRARVFWADETGWIPVVESDGHRLRWGRQLEGQPVPGGVLLALPIGDDEDPPLLLLVEGTLGPEAIQDLEELACLAARVLYDLAPGGRRFLAWCALRLDARRKLLDGLEDRSREVRKASAEALVRHGVDLLGYAVDLPRGERAPLRAEIEETASFREWWLENVTLD